jgi:hypothetical protein
MIHFDREYIIPGDIFADETVLCIRCGVKILGLSYKEMPKINNPQEKVNVAHKIKYGNYRQVPVVLYRRGKESITCLPTCQDCVKEINPEVHSDLIIRQIKRAMQIEAKWAGMPDEAIEGISRSMADARIVRKLNSNEVMENRILEGV